MERLTDEYGCMTECDSCPWRSGCFGVCTGVERALDRLKEYEELGLTPDQLRRILPALPVEMRGTGKIQGGDCGSPQGAAGEK